MEFTRASQVATGILFHSSMMISRRWWTLETIRSSTFHLRLPNRCSIGFRSGDMLGQSITFTLIFFSKAAVVLEVCLGSLSCWNTALRPSFQREGIMLCFSISQYMLAFMVLSMNCSSLVLAALMKPQTMTVPPQCLTVGKTHLSLYSLPGCPHILEPYTKPYLNQMSLSWSHQTTVIHVLSLLVFSKLTLTPPPLQPLQQCCICKKVSKYECTCGGCDHTSGIGVSITCEYVTTPPTLLPPTV